MTDSAPPVSVPPSASPVDPLREREVVALEKIASALVLLAHRGVPTLSQEVKYLCGAVARIR